MATGDIPIPLELCHTQCLVRAGDTDSSLPAFPLMKEHRRKSPSTPRSTTEVSGAIAHHVYCQDLQEAIKLKKKLEKGSKRCISLFAHSQGSPGSKAFLFSLTTGLSVGTRHVLLVLCPSASEPLPSGVRPHGTSGFQKFRIISSCGSSATSTSCPQICLSHSPDGPELFLN